MSNYFALRGVTRKESLRVTAEDSLCSQRTLPEVNGPMEHLDFLATLVGRKLPRRTGRQLIANMYAASEDLSMNANDLLGEDSTTATTLPISNPSHIDSVPPVVDHEDIVSPVIFNEKEKPHKKVSPLRTGL